MVDVVGVLASILGLGIFVAIVASTTTRDREIHEKSLLEAKKHREKMQRDAKKIKEEETLKGLTPTINIIDQAKISRKAIESFPFDELYPVIELLESDQNIMEAIDILHDDIKHVYIELLTPHSDKYDHTSKHIFDAQLAIDLLPCMDFGRRQIIKREEVMRCLKGQNVNRGASKRIAKTHSWDDLKSKFD